MPARSRTIPKKIKKNKFATLYIDKYSPRNDDYGPIVELAPGELRSAKALGEALRRQSVLLKGARVRSVKAGGAGKYFVSPELPGMQGYWQTVVLQRMS